MLFRSVRFCLLMVDVEEGVVVVLDAHLEAQGLLGAMAEGELGSVEIMSMMREGLTARKMVIPRRLALITWIGIRRAGKVNV